MGILVGNSLEDSRSLLVQNKVSGSRGSRYSVKREREIRYIYFCTCINPSYLQREYCWVFVGIGSVYSSQWYYSVA